MLGTTPEHIKQIVAVDGIKPRVIPKMTFTKLSGLESMIIRPDTNFVNIERGKMLQVLLSFEN